MSIEEKNESRDVQEWEITPRTLCMEENLFGETPQIGTNMLLFRRAFGAGSERHVCANEKNWSIVWSQVTHLSRHVLSVEWMRARIENGGITFPDFFCLSRKGLSAGNSPSSRINFAKKKTVVLISTLSVPEAHPVSAPTPPPTAYGL